MRYSDPTSEARDRFPLLSRMAIPRRGGESHTRSVPAIVVLPVLALLVAGEPVLAQEPAEEPCTEREETRQLDFWIGTWDVYNAEGEQAGVNVIERQLGGCMLLESWTGASGLRGKSMNYWDPQRETWRQVWVSDRGNVLDYRRGEYRAGAMRFRGITIGEAGDTTQEKLSFEAVSADTVLQVFEASTDGGATWDTTWVGVYVRRSGVGPAGSAGSAGGGAGSAGGGT